MTLTLEVSPETALRVERAVSLGANMDTLICTALEHWVTSADPQDSPVPHSIAHLAGTYEGESWDELLTEIERNRQQETAPEPKRK